MLEEIAEQAAVEQQAEEMEARLQAREKLKQPKAGKPKEADSDEALAAGGKPFILEGEEEAKRLRKLREVAGKKGRVKCEVSKDYDITRRNLEAALVEVGGDILFEKDNVLLTPGKDQNMRELTPASLKGITARHLEYGYHRQDKDGGERWVSQSPPTDVLEYLRDSPRDFPSIVKPLRRHVTAPVMLADGTVTTEPGYYPGAAIYYSGRVRHQELSMSLQKAIRVLREPFAEFPFVDESDLANALALPFTLVGYELFRGPPPIFAIIAPKEGTGKGLLASIAPILATGQGAKTLTYSSDPDAFEKSLFSTLTTAPQAVNIDNVNGLLDSPKWCSMTTEETTSTRRLGTNIMAEIRNDTTWIVNGNNFEMAGELVRRSVLTRIDARCEDPEERTFQIKDLANWIRQPDNQARYVTAVLTILRHWREAGSPRFTARKLGSFVSWCEVIGGVLEFIGHGEFLANKDHFRSTADPEREMWRAFVSEWWKWHRHAEVSAGDLCEVVNYHDPGANYRIRQEPLLPIGGHANSNPAIKLGCLLKKKVGQVFRVRGVGELQITRTESKITGHKAYCLQPVVSDTKDFLEREEATSK